MNIATCDICGARLPGQEKLEAKKQKLPFMKNPYGYFTFSHFKAMTDAQEKVVGHNWGCPATDTLCPECADRIDAAIREAIIKIAADAPAIRTYKTRAPYMDMEPMQIPEEPTTCG